MSSPRLLVGLGNPGPKYRATRHNVGFSVLDRLLERVSKKWNWASSCAVCSEISIEGYELVLMKPMTYMNLSGTAVGPWVQRLGLSPSEVFVVFDDVSLPLGRVRLRERGRAGGHNGLGSILETLDDERVPRLRIGVGSDGRIDDLAEYVLEPFAEDEQTKLNEVLDLSVRATCSVLKEGMPKSMSIFNAAVV